MTAEKDPRIEAVAKLLFTGPLFTYNDRDWDKRDRHHLHRRECLMAAEDVLRGIDEAAEWEYGIQIVGSANIHQEGGRTGRAILAGVYGPVAQRYRRRPDRAPGRWEPLS